MRSKQAATWLHAAGYNGRRFPIVIGEVGSAFETVSDKQWLQDFADFINAEVSRSQGLVTAVCLCPLVWLARFLCVHEVTC